MHLDIFNSNNLIIPILFTISTHHNDFLLISKYISNFTNNECRISCYIPLNYVFFVFITGKKNQYIKCN